MAFTLYSEIPKSTEQLLSSASIQFVTLNIKTLLNDKVSDKQHEFVQAVNNDVIIGQAIYNIIDSLEKSNQPIDSCFYIHRKYYHISCCLAVKKQWFFKQHPVVKIMIRDISEYVKTHRYLNRAYETQLKINKTKMAFLSRMSHEFRTPLNAVIGYSDAIKHKLYGEISKPYLEYIDNIHDAGSYLLDIVNDIMDVSYADNYDMHIKPSDFLVIPTIENLIKFMHSLLTKQKIIVNLSHNIDDEFMIFNDFNLFKRIFINIIGNATKYCPPYASLDININYNNTNRQLDIDIHDNGAGFPKSVIDNFGIPFNVDHNFLIDNQKSTGLGLSIINTAIQAMQGNVHIGNHVEGGAIININIPSYYQAERIAG